MKINATGPSRRTIYTVGKGMVFSFVGGSEDEAYQMMGCQANALPREYVCLRTGTKYTVTAEQLTVFIYPDAELILGRRVV
jgi:hypothetical protein